MIIKWSDDLNIGIEKIDQQHKEIFTQSNYFLKKIKEDKDNPAELKSNIEDLFYFLTDYFVTHFNDEERLQQKYNYPRYEQHKKVHHNFIERINQIKYSFWNEDHDIDYLKHEIKDEILVWLKDHIIKEDRLISEYIKEQ
ncbi:bacteriohemerythrin [Orenia marismortui]|uniref:Hemerythrin n=1 Tax=Orenia marismortui TaxID=46469 RepID=A0A4R8H115_9FIRM|nr:hemerythrin family protein [Orenia marismortui]TDX53218.1 hemerythrin [Orenia marismortui]